MNGDFQVTLKKYSELRTPKANSNCDTGKKSTQQTPAQHSQSPCLSLVPYLSNQTGLSTPVTLELSGGGGRGSEKFKENLRFEASLE